MAVRRSYQDAGGTLPPDWRALARLTDLLAWIDILSRPHAGAKVIERARKFIRAVIADRTMDDG